MTTRWRRQWAAGLALSRRELGVLAPWFSFFASVALVSFIQDLVIDDAAPSRLLGLDGRGYDRMVVWCLWFLIGALLNSHDVRHGTRAFLDTLPVGPGVRFVWRALAGLTAVVVVAAMGEIATVIQAVRDAARTGEGDLGGALSAIALGTATTAIRHGAALGLGLLLAPLRQVTWVLSFLLFIGLLIADDLHPELHSLLPTFLGVPSELGDGVRIAGGGVLLAATVAAVTMGASAVIAALRRGSASLHSFRLRAITGLLVVGMFGWVWKVAWDRVPYTPVEVQSRRYIFGLPHTVRLSLTQLETYDADLEEIEARLGHTLSRPVRADATGSLENAHGKASGLAIALTALSVRERFVVAHETTHAIADDIVGFGHPHLQIFSEGLANHVARRLTTTTHPDHADPMGRLVALAHEGRLDDHLVWNAEAGREAGGDLFVYAMGEIVVDSMVDVYGDDAPARVLRALSQTPPRGLKDEALWHDVLARAGMMLEPIRARVFEKVKAALAAADLPALPARPIVAARIEGDALHMSGVDQDGAPIDGVDCLVRNHPAEEFERRYRTCVLPLRLLAGPTAEVRVSIGDNVHSLWTRVALPPR